MVGIKKLWLARKKMKYIELGKAFELIISYLANIAKTSWFTFWRNISLNSSKVLSMASSFTHINGSPYTQWRKHSSD